MSDNLTSDLQMEWIDWDDWIDFSTANDEAAGDCQSYGRYAPMPQHWMNDTAADDDQSTLFPDMGTLLPDISADHRSVYQPVSATFFEVLQPEVREAHAEDLTAELGLAQCSNASPALMVPKKHRINSDRNSNLTRRQTAEGYICSYRFCTYKKPFARSADLDRHVNAKHAKTKVFVCPVKGCFKKQIRRTFSRVDKLKLHLQTEHDANAMVECHERQCAGVAIRLIELRVHFELAHGQCNVLRSLPQWICPLKSCRQRRNEWDLYEHMVQHHQSGDLDNIKTARQSIEAKSILLSETQDDASGNGSKPRAQNLLIVCPVCSALCSDADAFQQHMTMVHFVDPSQQEHLRLWTNLCQKFHPDTRYDPRMSVWQVDYGQDGVLCPACFSLEPVSPSGTNDHHISMQRTNWDDLRLHRRQILELYPEFGTEDCWMPAWTDLAV